MMSCSESRNKTQVLQSSMVRSVIVSGPVLETLYTRQGELRTLTFYVQNVIIMTTFLVDVRTDQVPEILTLAILESDTSGLRLSQNIL